MAIVSTGSTRDRIAGAGVPAIAVEDFHKDVVRDDLPLKATRITHLGFVVQKGKRTWLRHAARSRYARVVDEDLETFLARNAKYTKWKVTGVSLFEARPPPEAGEEAVVRSP